MTAAADRFTDIINLTWDGREPWQATAERGLSDTDAEALRQFCEEEGDDYDAAEAEVLGYVRGVERARVGN